MPLTNGLKTLDVVMSPTFDVGNRRNIVSQLGANSERRVIEVNGHLLASKRVQVAHEFVKHA